MIKTNQVCKTYQRPNEPALQVLRDVDFSVDEGEFVAIVGPSGSGKSTLMNILGLLDQADTGTYELCGHCVSALTTKERARMRNEKIGFVFQQFHLLPRTTAAENVELPLVYSEQRNTRKLAIDALCRVGLQERLSHYPNELSGGQQQRVAIARALINNPAILLADEPTGNLDQKSGQQVIDLFHELNQAGSTIVLITHDEQLANHAERVVRIDDGRLTARLGRMAS